MSTRALTVAGFVVLAVAAAALYLTGRGRRAGLGPLREVVDAVGASAPGRIALALGWTWVGWHLLAR
jgi:hypothetical protein